MFTMFTDRDGKYQLAALAESGFDPLARTCRFMLTEEAHHMFVGESGVQRVAKRACELMKQGNGDVRAQGGVDLPTIQKYLNLWYSLSLDLFGGEVSSNAADAFAAGLKGRYKEDRYAEHKLIGSHFAMDVLKVAGSEAKVVHEDVPMRTALNEVLRTEYIKDCQRGVDRWNKTIKDEGISFQLVLPSNKFHRQIGMWAGHCFTPDGQMIDANAWAARRGEWLPTEADETFVKSLMQPVYAPGKMASWIAPPIKGINGLPEAFEYVRL
jgi:benzoyl-CoA 2,3-dioxygenase component B